MDRVLWIAFAVLVYLEIVLIVAQFCGMNSRAKRRDSQKECSCKDSIGYGYCAKCGGFKNSPYGELRIKIAKIVFNKYYLAKDWDKVANCTRELYLNLADRVLAAIPKPITSNEDKKYSLSDVEAIIEFVEVCGGLKNLRKALQITTRK